jgi:hypothetical protein
MRCDSGSISDLVPGVATVSGDTRLPAKIAGEGMGRAAFAALALKPRGAATLCE